MRPPPLLWRLRTFRDQDLSNLESTLPDDDSTQVTAFLSHLVFENKNEKYRQIFNNSQLSTL